MTESTSRPVGGTEFSWCKAVPGGTGITVLGLILSKPPTISFLQNALKDIQNSHPILRSKIHFDDSTRDGNGSPWGRGHAPAPAPASIIRPRPAPSP
ncbi:hypothetical protein S245_006305 [Arachis hypogaea]